MTNPADIEAQARGNVDATELTETGGKLFKVGYFERPVVDRLRDRETVQYVLRNYVDGIEVDETAHESADNRRSIACLTDERVLFVVGGGSADDDETFSVPLDDVVTVTVDERTLVVQELGSGDVHEYRFPVKNDGELDGAVEYLSEHASESVVDEQVERVDTLAAEAEQAFGDEQYAHALDAIEQAQEAYQRYERVAGKFDATTTPAVSADDLADLRASIRTARHRQTYESHFESAETRYEKSREQADDAPEAALDSLEAAIEEYERALDVATDHEVGDPEAVRGQLSAARSKREDLLVSRLGERVASVEVPEAPDELEATSETLESLLAEIRDLDVDRPEDVALIHEEAAGKLVAVHLRTARYRAREAVERFRDGDASAAQDVFAETAEHLRSLGDEADDLGVTDRVEEIDRLADVCAENANRARKSSLGLERNVELRPLDPDAEPEAQPSDAPDPSPTDAESSGAAMSAAGSEDGSGTPAMPDGEVTYDRIDKREQIGSGGNADVYLADVDDDGVVALKEPRMQGTLHADVVDEFVSEAETWSKLDDHDHVVSVVNYDAAPIPWIALEYMDRGDLATNRPRLDFAEKFRVAIELTDAVWHAHQRGIAHLDLKPANILFKSTDDERVGTPKIGDWGLAKLLLEHSKSIEGLSPQYSAPEQFDSETYGAADNQTDIYQLGIIVYELFAERHPFEGSTSQVMHSVLNDDPEPPSTYDEAIPTELDEVLLTATAKDRDERYEAMIYFRDALQRIAPSSQ